MWVLGTNQLGAPAQAVHSFNPGAISPVSFLKFISSNLLLAEDCLKSLILLPPPPRDYRHVQSDLAFAVLGIDPRAVWVLGKNSTH